MKFRPCIDLHNGKVKQIVGSSLDDNKPGKLKTNFSTDRPASWFAELYKKDNLTGGHVICLGPGNEEAAELALKTWPKGLQIGGGVNDLNAERWLAKGASHVIVTSHVFKNGKVEHEKLQNLVKKIGRERLVLDLSCRVRKSEHVIVTDRWQKYTDVVISKDTLEWLAKYCDEFLIHAADVEGKCGGIDEQLLRKLADWSPIPTTYAGGVSNFDDIVKIGELGGGRIDVTIGSALDIFGGNGISYSEIVAFMDDFNSRNVS